MSYTVVFVDSCHIQPYVYTTMYSCVYTQLCGFVYIIPDL